MDEYHPNILIVYFFHLVSKRPLSFIQVQEIGVQVDLDELGVADEIDSYARPVTVKNRNNRVMLYQRTAAADTTFVSASVPSKFIGGFFGDSSYGHVDPNSHHHINIVKEATSLISTVTQAYMLEHNGCLIIFLPCLTI